MVFTFLFKRQGRVYLNHLQFLLTCDGIRGAETALAKVNPDALLMTYQINAMGPILVTKVGMYAHLVFSF